MKTTRNESRTVLILAAVAMAALVLTSSASAGVISVSSLTNNESDIVNLGTTVVSAANLGAGGNSTVDINGIIHPVASAGNNGNGADLIPELTINSSFDGNYRSGHAATAGYTGDMVNLMGGIAGNGAPGPISLDISGLAIGTEYLFQGYWEANNFGQTASVTFEGTDTQTGIMGVGGLGTLISYTFTAGDTSLDADLSKTGGSDNIWWQGYSLQSTSPPPPPPATVTVTDDFNTPHDYLTAGTGGTVWDGVVNAGNAVALEADTTTTDELRIQATGSKGWNASTNNAPFLYMDVAGDFDARVEVPAQTSGNYNVGALMARLGDPSANGPAGEDYMMVTSNRFSSNAIQTRILQDGAQNDAYGSSNSPFPRYLRLTRTGNTFNGFESTDGTTWAPVNWGGTLGPALGLDLLRADLDGLPLQIGLWQGSFTTSGHSADFDNFSIVVPDPGGAIPEPATMAALALAVAGIGGYVKRRRRRA